MSKFWKYVQVKNSNLVVRLKTQIERAVKIGIKIINIILTLLNYLIFRDIKLRDHCNSLFEGKPFFLVGIIQFLRRTLTYY